jgi:hypothetical protein
MNWATSSLLYEHQREPCRGKRPKRCLVIAHRGDTKAGLENTLPAIESAIRLGVDGVEVDLQLTRDGQVVLFHDDDLRRLAGQEGMIGDLTLVECRSLRLANGSGVPTLEELLDLASISRSKPAPIGGRSATVAWRQGSPERSGGSPWMSPSSSHVFIPCRSGG